MIIAITGTPGVGKTTVAKLLVKKLEAGYISLSSTGKHLKGYYDKSRKTKIVRLSALQKAIERKIDKKEYSVIDGHLAHEMDADIVVVLRCNPRVLRRRMRKKKWDVSKIKENIEAEMLDSSTIESIERHGKKKVIEIDVSRRNPESTAILIKMLLNNHPMQKKYSPRIDWTKKYLKELIG